MIESRTIRSAIRYEIPNSRAVDKSTMAETSCRGVAVTIHELHRVKRIFELKTLKF